MKDKIEFVQNVENILILKKWKLTISLHEVSDDRQQQIIAKCFVETVIGGRVISKVYFHASHFSPLSRKYTIPIIVINPAATNNH